MTIDEAWLWFGALCGMAVLATFTVKVCQYVWKLCDLFME